MPKQYAFLKRRNEAIGRLILPQLAGGGVCAGRGWDVVIFHERMPIEHQESVQRATPNVTLTFVDIGASDFAHGTLHRRAYDWRLTLATLSDGGAEGAAADDERCPPTELSEGSRNGFGYRVMCHFWFVAVGEHLGAYARVLRIDEDIVVQRFDPARFDLEALAFGGGSGGAPGLATVEVQREMDEPDVTRGLGALARRFAAAQRPAPLVWRDAWPSPYTNVMLLDVPWVVAHFGAFRAAVNASECIFTNRWGDLPLWGVALMMYGVPYAAPERALGIWYEHGSHWHRLVSPPNLTTAAATS